MRDEQRQITPQSSSRGFTEKSDSSRKLPILVGESNPYGADPHYALYPAPNGSAGHRLATVILGIPRAAYLRSFDRVNLCSRRWSAAEARETARLLVEDAAREKFVLLGAKVSEAFGLEFTPFTFVGSPGTRRSYAILPHPSGRSRAWNEPGAVERARAVLRATGVLPVQPPSREECLADLPSASYSVERPARCENCGGLVEGRDCPECGAP